MTDRLLELSDPVALRALAHPVRLQLLRLVRAHRPVTGAELAVMTAESTASVSYHLSVLARHGFIEPDPAPGATRRHRPWRPAFDQLRITSDQPGGTPLESAGGAVLASLLSDARTEQDAYLTGPPPAQGDVGDAAVFQLSRLVLSAAQAEQLSAEVSAVIDRYRRDVDPGPGEARFAVTFVAVPTRSEQTGL